MEDEAKPILQNHLQNVEGNSSSSYLDSKGNPTVGYGFNMNSPEVPGIMTTLGIDPAKVQSGEYSLNDDDKQNVFNKIYDNKNQIYQAKKDTSFPGAQLNPAQEAAIKSLIYNNSNLVGPTMSDKLNNNDHIGVIKDILLNSNKNDDPGLLKRRLKEAELYGGPLDFNLAVKSLDSGEVDTLRNTINKMDNENELQKVRDQYPFLDTNYKAPLEQIAFKKGKINRMLSSTPNGEQ